MIYKRKEKREKEKIRMDKSAAERKKRGQLKYLGRDRFSWKRRHWQKKMEENNIENGKKHKKLGKNTERDRNKSLGYLWRVRNKQHYVRALSSFLFLFLLLLPRRLLLLWLLSLSAMLFFQKNLKHKKSVFFLFKNKNKTKERYYLKKDGAVKD